MKQMESEKQTKNEKQTKGEKRMEDEKQAARKRRDKRYNDYVKQVTPKHNFILNMLKAFVSGGFICVIGQMFSDWYGSMGLMKDEVSGYTTLSLILCDPDMSELGGAHHKICRCGLSGADYRLCQFGGSMCTGI